MKKGSKWSVLKVMLSIAGSLKMRKSRGFTDSRNTRDSRKDRWKWLFFNCVDDQDVFSPKKTPDFSKMKNKKYTNTTNKASAQRTKESDKAQSPSRKRRRGRQHSGWDTRAADQDTVRFAIHNFHKDQGHGPRGEFVCTDCSMRLDSDLSLYQHCRTKHASTLVNASCCGTSLYTLAAFASHAETQHVDQHLCIRCREFFDTPSGLEVHLRNRHGLSSRSNDDFYAEFVLFCMLCGACSGRSESHMATHMQEVHRMAAEGPICSAARLSHFICRVPLAVQADETLYMKTTKNHGKSKHDNKETEPMATAALDIDYLSKNGHKRSSVFPCIPVSLCCSSDDILGSLF